MDKPDELVLGYKLMIYKREDESRYIKTKMKGSETISDSDLGTFGMYLDKMKQDIVSGFKPDVEVETESDFLID